jgi:hypothetical protein
VQQCVDSDVALWYSWLHDKVAEAVEAQQGLEAAPQCQLEGASDGSAIQQQRQLRSSVAPAAALAATVVSVAAAVVAASYAMTEAGVDDVGLPVRRRQLRRHPQQPQLRMRGVQEQRSGE